MSSPQYPFGQAPASVTQYTAAVEEGSNRRFDLELAQKAKLAKADLDSRYKVAKMQAATEGERIAVDRWYKGEEVRLAEQTFTENVRQFDQKFGLSEADLTGWYQGNPTLAREKFGLEQQQFGLNVAKTAADLRSQPDRLFQYFNFAQNLPSLLGGNATREGVQAPTGTPQPNTIQGQLSELGYLSAAAGPGSSADPTLQALQNVYKTGFDKLGGQSLEGMSEPERGFLGSAGSFGGYDPSAAMAKYVGSRLGQ